MKADDLRVRQDIRKIQFLLAEKFIMSASTTFDTFDELDQLRCQINHAFFVVSGNVYARLDLEKVSGNYTLSGRRWLLFLEDSSIERFFNQVYVPFDCEFVVAEHTQPGVILTEVYRIQKNHDLQTYDWGTWIDENLTWPSDSLYHRRGDLQQVTVKSALIHDPPFETMVNKTGSTTGELEIGGLFYHVWIALESMLNFTTKVYPSPGNLFGEEQKNGTWDGMIGMILRKDVDLSYNSFVMTPSRMDEVDYSTSIVTTRAAVFIRRPDTTNHMEIYFTPFSMGIWLCVMASFLIISTLLATFYYLGYKHGTPEVNGYPYTYYNALHFIWGVFCGQGHTVTPRTWACRLVFWIGHITAVCLISAYSANLTALFAVHDVELPFTTLEGLLKDGTYRFGVSQKSGLYFLYEDASDPLMKRLFNEHLKLDEDNLPFDYEQGFLRVCRERYAFMELFDATVGLAKKIPCQLVVLPQASFPLTLGVVFSKRNPYRAIVDHGLIELRDLGVLNHLYLREWFKEPNAPAEPVVTAKLSDVQLLFYMLGVGLLISLLCVMTESIIDKTRNRVSLLMHRIRSSSKEDTEFKVVTSTKRHTRHSNFNHITRHNQRIFVENRKILHHIDVNQLNLFNVPELI